MVKLRIIAIIFFGLILAASGGFTQSKVASKVQDKKDVKKNPITAEKKLPKDVPVVPLTEARITYDHIIFDFGYVPPGSKVTHSFPVKNTGPDTLNITKIKAGWGCTSTQQGGIVIPPGESTTIDVTYSASKPKTYTGKSSKMIRVYSNDSLHSQTELTIKADAGNPNHQLLVTPEQADFGQVLIGEDNRTVVTLVNNSAYVLNLRIVDMPSSSQIQDVNIRNSSLNPSASTEIEFVLNDFMMLGDFKTSLTIESGRDLSTRTTVPISGAVIVKQGGLNK